MVIQDGILYLRRLSVFARDRHTDVGVCSLNLLIDGLAEPLTAAGDQGRLAIQYDILDRPPNYCLNNGDRNDLGEQAWRRCAWQVH